MDFLLDFCQIRLWLRTSIPRIWRWMTHSCCLGHARTARTARTVVGLATLHSDRDVNDHDCLSTKESEASWIKRRACRSNDSRPKAKAQVRYQTDKPLALLLCVCVCVWRENCAIAAGRLWPPVQYSTVSTLAVRIRQKAKPRRTLIAIPIVSFGFFLFLPSYLFLHSSFLFLPSVHPLPSISFLPN